MMKCILKAASAAMLVATSAVTAVAFEPPLFQLNADQLKAIDAYASERGHKAFAASPDGKFGTASGYISATIASREALKACDAEGVGCVLIDLDGQPVPLALQYAQMSRADSDAADNPLPLRDLSINADIHEALEGYKEKSGNKAFAVSLKGPWGRAWEAATAEEAAEEALNTCNKLERAKGAPCFILMTNGERVSGDELLARPDMSVTPLKTQ
jgi:hypothetical protein